MDPILCPECSGKTYYPPTEIRGILEVICVRCGVVVGYYSLDTGIFFKDIDFEIKAKSRFQRLVLI